VFRRKRNAFSATGQGFFLTKACVLQFSSVMWKSILVKDKIFKTKHIFVVFDLKMPPEEEQKK
jgi:hypothetical protein